MDAADLRMFQSVASTGSMSKAALELNTVQSNVTARIKSLEDEVGFALFERTNRGVTLTAAGQRLLPFATRAARLLDDAKRAVADAGTPSGALVIGSLETTAALRLSSPEIRHSNPRDRNVAGSTQKSPETVWRSPRR